MRVLIFHGYLLRGTGSNIYNAELAPALVSGPMRSVEDCIEITAAPLDAVRRDWGRILPVPACHARPVTPPQRWQGMTSRENFFIFSWPFVPPLPTDHRKSSVARLDRLEQGEGEGEGGRGSWAIQPGRERAVWPN